MTRFASSVCLAALLLICSQTHRLAGQQPIPMQPMAPGAQPAAPNAGPPKPLDPNVIESSIARGVEYLRAVQKPTGIWGDGNGKEVGSAGGWAVGYTALAGLALIESGASPSDPAVARAAFVVRAGAPHLVDTYEVALAIIFLDRLKDSKRDDRLIHSLAARLIAGQGATGGWGYKVPKATDADARRVFDALRKLTPPPPPTVASYSERPSRMGLCIKAADDFAAAESDRAALDQADAEAVRAAAVKTVPTHVRQAAVFKDFSTLPQKDPDKKTNDPYDPTTDTSNTHFATIGLWTARRHDVPTERSFTLLARRFRTSFGGDGWSYHYAKGGAGSTPALTCIGLLGLAIGNALGVDPGAPRADKDPVIIKSLTMLSKKVGAPTGQTRDRPSPKDVGGLYYLWALERIAVLYDIRTLDDKDWYQWGAEILIGHQLPDGSWKDAMVHGDHPVVDTALAVLFLKRANLTQDLSKRLVVDSSRLVSKVSVPPKKDPPPPTPKFDFSALFTAPTPKDEPPPKAAVPESKPAPPPAPAPVAETPASKKEAGTSPWVWVGLGAGVLLLAGAGVAFLVMRKKPEEKPKKKGKKTGGKPVKAAKAKPEGDEDDRPAQANTSVTTRP
jgi:hypothetical protein